MSQERKKKSLQIHPEEADVVKRIYSLYLDGLGAKAVAGRLNGEGLSYRGKPWSKGRILDIVGDEAYAGRYYYNKKDGRTNRLKPPEEWIKIPVDPIIDEVTWERVNTLKKSRDPRKPESNSAITGSKTLLTGIAVCGLCGSNMALETGKGGRYVYYNCRSFLRVGKTHCRGQRIPAERFERAILEHMSEKLFTKDRVKSILKGVYKELKTLDQRQENQRKSLRRQLEDVDKRLTKQYEAIEEGHVDISCVGERIKELHVRRENLEDRLEELKAPQTIPLHYFTDQSLSTLQKRIRALFLDNEDRTLTKSYLRLFIEKIVIDLPNVEITGKVGAVIGLLQKETAAGDVPTAVDGWLPEQDSNLRQSG